MSAARNHKRKKLFIDPVVQGAIIRRIMLHWVLSIGTIFFFLFVMEMLLNGLHLSFGTHMANIWQQYGLLIVCLFCLMPVFAYDSIKLSHRFAGPMISFRRALRQLADGKDVRAVRFRDGDFWQPMADELNQLADRMREAGLLRSENAKSTNKK